MGPSRLAPRGFTVVELVVVIGIGATMAGLAAASARNFSATRSTATAARVLMNELIDLRMLAVARGVPVGVCVRTQDYVSPTGEVDDRAGTRTVFAGDRPRANVTPNDAVMTLPLADRRLQHRHMTFEPNGLQLHVEGDPRTVTLLFDSFGRPTAWAGDSCAATAKTPIAMPLTLRLDRDGAGRSRTEVVLDAAGALRMSR